MKLEELLEDKTADGQIEKSLEIANREWTHIRSSLELCGDIGEFNKEDFMIGILEEDVILKQTEISPTKSVSVYAPTFYPMYFLKNLLAMNESLSKYNYMSPEALYVFIELVTKAAERLGLIGTFSMGFGSGYGNVRTGWIGEKGLPNERTIFFKMFFKGEKVDYDWDFHWNSVKTKIKIIYDKFTTWQNNPIIYKKEVTPKTIIKPMMV